MCCKQYEMEEDMKDVFIVYSKKVATELVEKGFKILKTEVNIKDTRFLVFIFENSVELQEIIKGYKK